jgi:hypothetical protein
MAMTVFDEAGEGPLAVVDAALDDLFACGIDPTDADAARALIVSVERLARRVRAAQVEVLNQVDRRGLHRADGHASAKVVVRHHAKTSDPEALRRTKACRMLRDLTEVGAAWRAGTIGSCQVDRVARSHANPRARAWFVANEALVLHAAQTMGYRLFDLQVTDWERLADQDGTCDRSQQRHDNRDATLSQDYDGGWTLRAGCGSIQGAELREILARFLDAEVAADWAIARAEHGDDATADQLPRTDNQRRFDALYKMFQRGASAHADEPGGSVVVTNIVIDHTTFEREIRRLFGTADEAPGPRTADELARFRCSTLDGNPVDPTESVATALLGHIRRVVIGSGSVAIDLGRRSRLFTGPAQLAARLSATECYWPGCQVPVSQCQIDHLQPWAPPHNGSTSPGNGAPACGRHNRFKQQGFNAWRDPAGGWHILRPDGTELT